MERLVKKLIGWILCAVMVVGMLPVAAREAKAADTDAGAPEGIVLKEGCYEISSYAGLLEFARIVNGTSAQFGTNSAANAKIVVKEINASVSNPTSSGYDEQTTAWIPIGKSSSPYTGKFDGNGCTIKRLTIDSSDNSIGLFGYVGEGGCVQNVNLEGGSISGSGCVGGVVGLSNGEVSGCHNDGAVSGGYSVGGVVGYNDGGKVSNCYNTGKVSTENVDSSVGGVVGYNEGGKVSNCYNTGKVGAENNGSSVGGVVGINFGTVSNCYNTGDVKGNNKVGGVAGWNDGTVENCYNTGDVKGNTDVGGVAGDNYGTVSNCYNTGDVSGSVNFVGGVVGYNSSRYGTVENCYNTGDVEGNNKVGGVAGANSNGRVSNCYNTGAVSGSSHVGGVVGVNYGTVSKCYYNNSICQVGAIAGSDDGDNAKGLSTTQMTGENALSNMALSDSIWLTKAHGGSDGGQYYLYYPQLKGFNYKADGTLETDSTEIISDNWPAKVEVKVSWNEPDSYTYDGSEKNPTVTSIIVGDDSIPDGASVSYSVYGSSTWGEPTSDAPDSPGQYKMECDVAGEKVTKYFSILSPEVDYAVSYLKSEKEKWEQSTESINSGEYKAVISWTEDGHANIEKEFDILLEPVTLTADSASAECDGTALTKNSYTISGLAKGDSVESVTITGSQTGPGSGDNVPSAATIVNAAGEDVTDCYDITYVNGTLTVSEHSFDREVADAKYQKSAADCTHAAVYYKSCKCGEKGTETFESGEPLGHGYKAVEGTAVAPTCEKPGKEADQKCERCGDVITGKEIPATGHTWKAATGYAPKTCEICGATEGDVIKYTVEGGNTIEFTQGDQQDITKIYHRSEDDKDSFAHYVGVQIDGKDTKIKARSGSIILAFDAKTLNSLSVGEHVVTVVFDDWKDEMKLIVKAPAEEEVKNSPPTGDSSLPVLWVTLLLLSMAGATVVVMRRRKRA